MSQDVIEEPQSTSSLPSENDSVESGNTDNSSTTKKEAVPPRFVRSGIGGRGNYRKVDPSTWSTTTPRISLIERCARPFRTGVGGAGNRCPTNADGPVISPAEQLARIQAQRDHAAGVYYHVGLGGTGNRAKRDSLFPSPSSSQQHQPQDQQQQPESALLAESKPVVQYSDQPLRVGAADRLAAKLFGRR